MSPSDLLSALTHFDGDIAAIEPKIARLPRKMGGEYVPANGLNHQAEGVASADPRLSESEVAGASPARDTSSGDFAKSDEAQSQPNRSSYADHEPNRIRPGLAGDIVVCSTPPATFAEALALIEASDTVDCTQFHAMRRDVNWVQARLPRSRNGSPAGPLPCDPLLLRPILLTFRPGSHKISDKRWSNIRGELARVQRKTGWLPARKGQAVLTSQLWQVGLERVAPASASAMFRGFATFCEQQDLKPVEVVPAHLRAYHDYIALNRAKLIPGATIDALRYTWNRLCREHADWTGRPLPNKRNPNFIQSESDQIPSSYFTDINDYCAKLRNPGRFDRRIPQRLADATISTRRGIFKLSASVLVNSGWDADKILSLQSISSPAAVQAILTAYDDRTSKGADWTKGAETTAVTLKMLARQWGDLSAEDLTKVEELCDSVRPPKQNFPKKTRERLRQFDDRATERRFWDLPRKLWEEVVPKHECRGRKIRAAQLAKVAVALAIAFDKPLRIGNLTNLDLDLDFERDKKGKIVGVRIEGDRTSKGAPIIEAALSPRTQNMIKVFVESFRTRLLIVNSTALFPGQKHTYLASSGFGEFIERTIRRHVGIDVNPHLIRAIVATVILEEDPRDVVLVQRTLDHKSPSTSIRSYAQQRGRSVNGELAERLRRRIRKLQK